MVESDGLNRMGGIGWVELDGLDRMDWIRWLNRIIKSNGRIGWLSRMVELAKRLDSQPTLETPS